LHNLQTLYNQGGLTVIALIALSILALGVGFERLFATWLSRKRMVDSITRIQEHIGDKNRTMAQAVNETMPKHPAARLFAMVLADQTPSSTELRRAQNRILRSVRRRLWVLASIGAIAPFVGLFGTVLGVMEAFHQIGMQGTGGFQVVSTGISGALISTAAGIFVGIEAVLLFNYLQVYVGEYSATLREATEELLESVGGAAHAV
jgi:biopolymer transport protein ExbB